MARNTTFRIFQCSSIAGCFLVLLCIGLPWFWGNLFVYMESYLWAKHATKLSSAWTPSIFLLTWNLPAVAVYLPVQRLGTRWTMLLGIIMMEAGLVLGWFGIVYLEFPLELGFGALYGLGACFIYTVSLQIAMDWTDEHTSFAASCLQAAFGVGGLVTNQAITFYINPSNDNPEAVGNQVPFFYERDINERVPKFIIIFIITTSAMSLSGFALLRDRYSMRLEDFENDHGIHSLKTEHSCKRFEKESLLHTSKKYTPRDLLKCKAFYVLLFGVFTADVVYLVSTTYYKSFGETKISNDHFLTFTGTTPPVFNTVFVIVTGIAMDRYGPQIPLMAVDVVLTFSSLFFYFSPQGGKWTFYVCIQIFMGGGGTFYSAVLLAFIRIFGKYQLPIKLTMLFSVSLISTLTIPYLIDHVILPLGWYSLFTFSSIVSILALILIAMFMTQSKLQSSGTGFHI